METYIKNIDKSLIHKECFEKKGNHDLRFTQDQEDGVEPGKMSLKYREEGNLR